MRILWALAPLTVAIAAPASATELRTYTADSLDALPGAFTGFNPALGTLTGVTLTAQTISRRALYATGTTSVDWAIDGVMNLYLRPFPNGASLAPLQFTTHGSGTGSRTGEGEIMMSATGSHTFNLDPSLFGFFLIDRGPTFDFSIDAVDPGLFSYSDVSLTPVNAPVFAELNGCGNGRQGSDACNRTTYSLTYAFNSPVPEPASWAMMMIGFLAIGALRQRWAPRRSASC